MSTTDYTSLRAGVDNSAAAPASAGAGRELFLSFMLEKYLLHFSPEIL